MKDRFLSCKIKVKARKKACGRKGESMIDLNQPITNPELKKYIAQMQVNNNDENVGQVFQEIAMNAHFLGVVVLSQEPEKTEEGRRTIKADTQIQLPMLTSMENENFYPAFTDWEELNKWQQVGERPSTMMFTFDDYAHMVLEDENVQGIVINPFGENLILDRGMLEELRAKKEMVTKGVAERKFADGEEVLLGEPNEYPEEMIRDIREYMNTKETIKKAWLRLMVKGEEQSYLLVVDFEGEESIVFSEIADVARPYLTNRYLDMIPYESSLGKKATENTEAFWIKKR